MPSKTQLLSVVGKPLQEFRQLEDKLIDATVNSYLTEELVENVRHVVLPILQEIKHRKPDLKWIDGCLKLYEGKDLKGYFELNRERFAARMRQNAINKGKPKKKKPGAFAYEPSTSLYTFSGGLPGLGKR